MNLVFNRWNNLDEPLPNLSELNVKNQHLFNISEYQFAQFPFFMNEGDLEDKMGMEKTNIRKCKLDDITTNETFYFIISLRYSLTFSIKKGDIFLPQEIEKYIEDYNLKIIFLSELETHKYYDTFIELLIKKIKRKNWKEENFYLIDNNSMHKKVQEKFKTNINFFKINYFLHLLGKESNNMNENNLEFDKKFIFLCHNREAHHHRVILLTHLKYNKLLENDIVNWSLVFNQVNENTTTDSVSISRFKDFLDINNKELVSEYIKMRKTQNLCYYETNSKVNNGRDGYNIIGFVTNESFKNAYINIVTETHYINSEYVHITEKSFKPFYYFQMPIFLSAYHHVKCLKQEYGFHLFEELIDHSYDNEPDDSKRFYLLLNEIKRLSTMRQEINVFYKNNVDKFIHNYNIIKNNKFEKKFTDYILNV